eukprot:CAMPEP_0172504548 /NCGR_PEP_ID=MMETSP1066-20121228/179716_1 /TAXON_ID=671091 /ORGANISM="Coscinodiscus wailesii, Strain CCMP2513" /LENGTH=222 /DNA_ID=CAMNT_0013280779 /DNA_START=100 /DNA_END=768 /DNA_ORIENTATION=-
MSDRMPMYNKYRSRRSLVTTREHEDTATRPRRNTVAVRPGMERALSVPVGIGMRPPIRKKGGLFSTIVSNLKQEVSENEENDDEFIDESKIKDMVDTNSQRQVLNDMLFSKDEAFTVNEDGLITLTEDKPSGGIFGMLQTSAHTDKVDYKEQPLKSDPEQTEDEINRSKPIPPSKFLNSFLSDTVKAKIMKHRNSFTDSQLRQNLTNKPIKEEVDGCWDESK